MLSLVDKPIIQYGVEEAIAGGIEEIIIITGRGKTAIEDHFDISYELDALLESPRQEGVAGAKPQYLGDGAGSDGASKGSERSRGTLYCARRRSSAMNHSLSFCQMM